MGGIILPSDARQSRTALQADDEARWTKYFPWEAGDKLVYIAFNVNPSDPRRKALSTASIWREVVEERTIHGMRAIVVRDSEGALMSDGQGLVFGPPEKIGSEHVYFVTAQGIDWRTRIGPLSPGTDEDYRTGGMARNLLVRAWKGNDPSGTPESRPADGNRVPHPLRTTDEDRALASG